MPSRQPKNIFNSMLQNFFIPLILLCLTTYVVLLAYLFTVQSRLLYLPARHLATTPASIHLPYETVSFTTADKIKISGWFVPATHPKGVILFCHGNAGNISHRLDSLQLFNRLGCSTLIFDYRGYGDSEGSPSEKGTYRDAEAAWRYLVDNRKIPEQDIILFGRSLGGAVAAGLAQRHDPMGLIVESTFTSVPDLAAELYPWLPARALSRFSYNALAAIKQVRCPLLVIHSREDEIIPYAHGRRLYDAAGAPKEMLVISGDHNTGFLLSGKRYTEGIADFLARLTKKRTHRETTFPEN